MRKICLFSTLILLLAASCKEDALRYYSGENLVQFSDVRFNYYWAGALNPALDYDTLWVNVQAMGNAVEYDRPITLVQDTAKIFKPVYDHVGNLVDSAVYIVPNQAVEGKHYVPFKDSKLKEKMKLPANKYRALIPIVLLKDPDMKKALTLQFRLVSTETTKVGDRKYAKCTVVIQ